MANYILSPIGDLREIPNPLSSFKYLIQRDLSNILNLYPMTSFEATHTLRGSVKYS